jgi:predicted nuclease of restriction endonuclease-like (RecB) superfamily
MDEVMKEGEIILTDKRYLQLLDEAKQKVTSTRIQIAKAASRGQFELYWWFGESIVTAQTKFGWGKSVVEQLAKDLRKAFPETTHGFSTRNLWYMRNIYLEYKDLPILQQVVAEIPWGQNVVILDKIKDTNARQYYLEMTRQQGWTRSTLIMQIQSQAHERHLLSPKQHNFTQALPQHLAEQANNTMKDVYMFDTLGLTPPVLEAEIESRMVAKIKNVMLELGYGFAFMGNQYRIQAKSREYFIDLLFYNRRLQCLVALELKKGKFEPEYAGKMNFYLNLLDDFIREPHENPSIGIILCSERDSFEVEYALRSTKNPVGVAEFRLAKTLPKELLDKLPNPKELEAELRRGLDAHDMNEIETDDELEKICV